MRINRELSPYKKKKRAGILWNLAICGISYACIKMAWLSLVPVFTCAISLIMALFHAMYFFFNYDDEQESLESFLQNEKYITTNLNQMPNKHKKP